MPVRLKFDIESLGGSSLLTIVDPLLFLAAFTGRDAAETHRHVEELRRIGVPTPAEVPTAYALPSWLLASSGETLQLATATASGEVEPVLIQAPDGELYVTVGSDHTDREVERTSIELSKLVCPKVVARRAWLLDEVEEHWDDLVVHSSVEPGGAVYQEARLGALMPPRDLLLLIDERFGSEIGRPRVIFLGTVPLNGGFSFGSFFEARLEDRSLGRTLACEYQIEMIQAPSGVRT